MIEFLEWNFLWDDVWRLTIWQMGSLLEAYLWVFVGIGIAYHAHVLLAGNPFDDAPQPAAEINEETREVCAALSEAIDAYEQQERKRHRAAKERIESLIQSNLDR